MSFVWLSKYVAVISLNSGPYNVDAIFCGKNLIFKYTNFRLWTIKELRKILQAKQFPYSTSFETYLRKCIATASTVYFKGAYKYLRCNFIVVNYENVIQQYLYLSTHGSVLQRSSTSWWSHFVDSRNALPYRKVQFHCLINNLITRCGNSCAQKFYFFIYTQYIPLKVNRISVPPKC
jgi:hypothetical protein